MSTATSTITKRNITSKISRPVGLPRHSEMAAGIEVSMIKRMQLMANKNPNVISLAQGIPSFETPEHICAAAKRAIDNHMVDKYTSGYGIDPLREAIADKVTRENRIPTDSSQVLVTHGGIEAMMTVFKTLLNPYDEVIVLTPDYASHITQVRIAANGQMPVCVPLTETPEGWMLDPQKLVEAITPRSKVILICNPCNPTGKVYTEAELKTIVRIAERRNLYIVTDEMYEYFTFDGKRHISIASLPGAKERTISIFGFSKSYAMTGWRIGYIVASEHLISQMIKIHDSLVTCPAAVSQYAALAALQGPQNVVRDFRQAFEHRRQIVQQAIACSDKLQLATPEGSYFAFVKVLGDVDDFELAQRLLQEAEVAVVPGSAFGKGGESHIRISFGCDEIKLHEGLRRLVTFMDVNPMMV
jgi:aminotransferase